MSGRRALGLLLALVGLVALTAGLLAWSVLGTDGRWRSVSAATSASGVYLPPETVQRIDGPTRVTVEDRGSSPVTVAQAPVDDVLALVGGSDVVRVRPGGGLPGDLQLERPSGSTFRGLGRSDAASAEASGVGRVSLEVPRDVQRAVLVTADGRSLDGAVVTVTYHYRPWSLLAGGVVAGGAVLALVGGALAVRGRRRPRTTEAPA